MAAGDPIADVDLMPATSNLDFIPAAGTRYLITSALCVHVSTGVGIVINGVAIDARFVNSSVDQDRRNPNVSVFIDSTVTLRRRNSAAVAREVGFNGIQLK